MTVRVGIISANWGAIAHLPAWRSLPDVEVTSICTSRRETAEAAASRFGIARAFWDFRDMCADPDLDIIDCGTRPTLRQDMVLSALANRKHVYNGIPFAADLERAAAMLDAHRQAGTVGVIDALSQWIPAHRLLKERLEGGELGELFAGSCRFTTSLFNAPVPGFPYNWFHEGGHGVSAVRNMGSHALNLLVWLFGPVAEVVADDRMALKEWRFPNGETLTPETNDLANAILRFESGLVMQLQVSWTAVLGEGWALDVFGSKGRAHVADSQNFPTSRGTRLSTGQLGGAMSEVEIPERLTSADDVACDWTAPIPPVFPMALAMRSMVDAVAGKPGAEAAPGFAQGYEVERVQEAIRRSSTGRRWVALDEVP